MNTKFDSNESKHNNYNTWCTSTEVTLITAYQIYLVSFQWEVQNWIINTAKLDIRKWIAMMTIQVWQLLFKYIFIIIKFTAVMRFDVPESTWIRLDRNFNNKCDQS